MGGVTRLAFDLSDSMKNSIEAAKNEIESNTKRLGIRSLQYEKYGKNLLKKSKLSPDAILQLSIQVLTVYVDTLFSHCMYSVCMYDSTLTVNSMAECTVLFLVAMYVLFFTLCVM